MFSRSLYLRGRNFVKSSPSLSSTLKKQACLNFSSAATSSDREKLLLLYSGGLDTSVILHWLMSKGYDVVAYMANLGQEGEDFEAARKKALGIGAVDCIIDDLREPFLTEHILPAVQANAIYEGRYLMGTSLARPCIAKGAITAAQNHGCTALGHGATGKGNDQVRFELSMYALDPKISVVAPWRIREFLDQFEGRNDMIAYSEANGIPISNYGQAKPFSMDDNMMHVSYESGVLEDPRHPPPEEMWRMTTNPAEAPDTPQHIEITFEQGVPVSGKTVSGGLETISDPSNDSLSIFNWMNKLGMAHGIGRIDIVENRFVGIKSRGSYETPGGTILWAAHEDLEGITMDREVRRIRDMVSARFSDAVYNGFWFSPEMEYMINCVRDSQKRVTGTVELSLFKGHCTAVGRESPFSLYDKDLSSMDYEGGYDPTEAAGFIKINSIRLKAHHALLKREGKDIREELQQAIA